MRNRLLVTAIGVVGVIVALGIGRAAWKAHHAVEQVRKLRLLVADALREKNRWEKEKWAPEDFFSDAKMQQVCRAISAKDIRLVRRAIAGVADINQPGKSGVTLLFWAYFDENLDAFQLLLQEGANPDARLSEFIPRHNDQPFAAEDSVLFMSLRERNFEFFYVALEYTANVNQLDIWNQSLLIVATDYGVISSIDQTFVDRLLEKGIDLEHEDQYGGTAAHRAVGSERPLLCLHMLQAGANPYNETEEGETIAGRARINIELGERSRERARERFGDVSGGIDYLKDDRELLAWLEAQQGDRVGCDGRSALSAPVHNAVETQNTPELQQGTECF